MTNDANPKDGDVLDNPAARLRYWMRQATPYAEGSTARSAGSQAAQRRKPPVPFHMLECWSLIWDLKQHDPDDRIEYFVRAAAMIQAGRDIRCMAETAAATDPLAKHGLTDFHQIESALQCFMDAPTYDIAAQMAKVKDTGWRSLDILSDFLSAYAPEPTMLGDQIKTLIEQTRLLIDLVCQSDLPDDVKDDLSSRLEEIEKALRRAPMSGTADVKTAMDSFVGSLWRGSCQVVDFVGTKVGKVSVLFLIGLAGVLGQDHVVEAIENSPMSKVLELPVGSTAAPTVVLLPGQQSCDNAVDATVVEEEAS
jgi:hypothetical protein